MIGLRQLGVFERYAKTGLHPYNTDNLETAVFAGTYYLGVRDEHRYHIGRD